VPFQYRIGDIQAVLDLFYSFRQANAVSALQFYRRQDKPMHLAEYYPVAQLSVEIIVLLIFTAVDDGSRAGAFAIQLKAAFVLVAGCGNA
jgi:hypothetical protein